MTVRKVQFETMDDVNRFLNNRAFSICSGSEERSQDCQWKIYSRSCIHRPWQRNGFLCICAGDYVQP